VGAAQGVLSRISHRFAARGKKQGQAPISPQVEAFARATEEEMGASPYFFGQAGAICS